MKFAKFCILGNIYVVFSVRTLPRHSREFVRRICARAGIGAHGVCFLLPSTQADVAVRAFGADGTECVSHEAIRAAAAYLWEAAGLPLDVLEIRVKNRTIVIQRPNTQPHDFVVSYGKCKSVGTHIPITTRTVCVQGGLFDLFTRIFCLRADSCDRVNLQALAAGESPYFDPGRVTLCAVEYRDGQMRVRVHDPVWGERGAVLGAAGAALFSLFATGEGAPFRPYRVIFDGAEAVCMMDGTGTFQSRCPVQLLCRGVWEC